MGKGKSKPDKNLDPNLREILSILEISDKGDSYSVRVKINGVIRSGRASRAGRTF